MRICLNAGIDKNPVGFDKMQMDNNNLVKYIFLIALIPLSSINAPAEPVKRRLAISIEYLH
jgi:hypothetical protein